MRRDHSLIMKIEILAYSQLHMYTSIARKVQSNDKPYYYRSIKT